jgi:hypothetical protein
LNGRECRIPNSREDTSDPNAENQLPKASTTGIQTQ